MSSYRRFVTYLFRYEDGIKGTNCGFAKVEVRQEQCRMEIQIKGYEDGNCAVHLFVNTETGIEGVHIGDIGVRNGMGREIFLFGTEAVGDTPYNIDEAGGIYITVEGTGFIASQWNDDEIQWSSFRVYEKSGLSEESAPGKSITEECAAEEHISEKSVTEECAEKEHISEKSVTEESTSEENITEKQESGLEEKTEDSVYGKAEHTEKISLSAASPEIRATQAAAPQISSYMTAWERQWQRFTSLHPVFLPFDEEQNIYAVKMELRDFKALPKQYWSLANNSFLLHGYFNYKYVLFGYVDGEKKRWFLGVPGSFQNQEQLLAGIFGFTEFKTKHKTKQRTGEFGFWYRYLDM